MRPQYMEISEPQGLQKFTARKILNVFFRRRWVILGVFLPIFLFSVWGTINATDRFTARSRVLIEARSVETPEFQRLPVDNEVLISTAVQICQSIPVAERAAVFLMDEFEDMKARFPEQFRMVETEEDVRDLVLSELTSGQVGESNVIEIIYSHVNPDFAITVVEAVTRAFLEYMVESKQNTEALDYYTEQIQQVETEISGMMARRLDIFEKGGLNAYRDNTQSGIQHMRALEYDFHKAQSRRMGMESTYNRLVRAIEADPMLVPSLTTFGGQNSNLVGARQVYDNAVMELARMRMSFNDSSEFVKRQMIYVDQAKELFLDLRDAHVSEMKIQLDAAQSEEQALADALAEYQGGLLSYPAIERDLYAVDMEIESKKDLLEALQLKRGEIRLKAYGDQRISNITRLNQSTLDFGIQGGKKIIYLLLVSFIGLVLSFVVGLLVDNFDHRIFDVHQAEEHLQAPVLGAISNPGNAEPKA